MLIWELKGGKNRKLYELLRLNISRDSIFQLIIGGEEKLNSDNSTVICGGISTKISLNLLDCVVCAQKWVYFPYIRLFNSLLIFYFRLTFFGYSSFGMNIYNYSLVLLFFGTCDIIVSLMKGLKHNERNGFLSCKAR